MKYVSLANADAYYELASRARVSWREVQHPELEAFAEAVLELTRLARRADDDAGWREFLYPARRARNVSTTAPLPFSHRALALDTLVAQLEKSLPALRVYGGEDAGELGVRAVEAGHTVASSSDAPLLDAVLDIADSGRSGRTGLLLPLPELVVTVREALEEARPELSIEVLTRHDVASVEPIDRMVIIGPLYWYRNADYVFTSPRAPNITVLKWSWYREQPPARTSLDGSRGAAGISFRPAPVASTTFEIAAGEEAPTVDWSSISRELVGSPAEHEEADAVRACAAVLAGRHGVLLPDEGDRVVWILDPNAPKEHRIARVDVADLEPGHVIILRTSGGGDLIVPIANEILGADSWALRELQRRWKGKLRAWVSIRASLTNASDELQRRGCARANPQNLQNWLSERSLRTEDRGDWEVLMGAASLETEADAIWRAMGRLHSAHTEAGMSLGRRLREMADTQPLDQLAAAGVQRFALVHGGSLTAFRIEGFAPNSVMCTPSRLMVPMEVSDEWLT